MSKTIDESLKEQLQDPEFRAEWEALRPDFQIAQAILEYRAKTGTTEEQLAEASGISLMYIRRLESGTANPSLRTLKRLAAGMGMALHLEFVPISPASQ